MDDLQLDVRELANACHVSEAWIVELVEGGVLGTAGPRPGDWRFDSAALARVRAIARLRRDFDADVQLAALVTDLLEELERLRARLRRAGLDR